MSYVTKRKGNRWEIIDIQTGLTVVVSFNKSLVQRTLSALNGGGGFDTHVPLTLFNTPVRIDG